ncbi:MAG TPA: hypothetical protein VFR09_02175 [Alphaproteobacteria bacterium]|nr:hypothetical protein [Alphaproteobacteria bacterium]
METYIPKEESWFSGAYRLGWNMAQTLTSPALAERLESLKASVPEERLSADGEVKPMSNEEWKGFFRAHGNEACTLASYMAFRDVKSDRQPLVKPAPVSERHSVPV